MADRAVVRSCTSSVLAACAISLAFAGGVGASDTVNGTAFGRDPARFVGHEIRLAKVGCFSSSPGSGLRCTTYGGVYLLAKDVAPASLKAKIGAECGGIVETEDDPSCLFDAVFTPVSVRKGAGTIVRGDRSIEGPVWMVEAGIVTLAPHR